MKKEVLIRIFGGIKILKWKLISGFISGVLFGSLAVGLSLQNHIFEKSPILTVLFNILFFAIGFVAGFLAVATKYKNSPPSNKSDSS